MKIIRQPNPRSKPRIIRSTYKRKVTAPSYSLKDVFMEVLMFLPDQPARSVALDVVTGIGPGAIDTKASARIALKAAKRLGWERYRVLAKLAEHAGVEL